MPNLQHQWVIANTGHELLHITAVLVRTVERNGERHEDGSQSAFRRNGIQTRLSISFIRRPGSNRFRRCWLNHSNRGVCKRAIQFGCEDEFRVCAGGHPAPLFAKCRLDVPIERRVDFDQIEELRQVFDPILRFDRCGIDNSRPVPVSPTCYPDPYPGGHRRTGAAGASRTDCLF